MTKNVSNCIRLKQFHFILKFLIPIQYVYGCKIRKHNEEFKQQYKHIAMAELTYINTNKIRNKQFRRIVYIFRTKVTSKKADVPRKSFISSIREKCA